MYWPITTNVVSSNPTRGEMYSIQHYVISLSVTCDRSVVFTGYSCSLHQMTDRQDITDILLKVGLIAIAINHDVYVEMTDEIPVLENASENTNTLDGLWGGGAQNQVTGVVLVVRCQRNKKYE